MIKPEIIKPKDIKNRFYKIAGFIILVLNKVRHTIQGYTRPRAFPVTNIQQAIDYDVDVLDRLEDILKEYTKNKQPLKNKTLLELGPGADLGISLLSLDKEAKKYLALDVNSLAKKAPRAFYQTLIDQKKLDKNYLEDIEALFNNKCKKINYIVDKSFDPRIFTGEQVDLVISNAAFEHFDDTDETIRRLSELMPSGSIFLADIDLQTHTRWIREADPLNIYRYSKFIWKVFKFLGSPNRVRPEEYKKSLEKHGFTNIQIIPRIILEDSYIKQVKKSLYNDFIQDKNLNILDFYIIAKKI